MRPNATWTAFLLMCFALVGLTGLFASYAVIIPPGRTLARLEVLDQVLAASRQPDAPTRLDALRPMLGPVVGPQVMDGPGDLFDRVASQRQVVLQEGERETNSVVYRIRVMVAVVTVMSAVVGSGIMALNRRGAVQP